MWIVYLNLFWAYLKIGLFGFGGGYAMLSLIQHEAVEVIHYGESQPWLTPTEFTDIVAISQMTPGPIGINSATYVGYVATGNSVWGSLVATFAVCLPSFVLVLMISHFIRVASRSGGTDCLGGSATDEQRELSRLYIERGHRGRLVRPGALHPAPPHTGDCAGRCRGLCPLLK